MCGMYKHNSTHTCTYIHTQRRATSKECPSFWQVAQLPQRLDPSLPTKALLDIDVLRGRCKALYYVPGCS